MTPSAGHLFGRSPCSKEQPLKVCLAVLNPRVLLSLFSEDTWQLRSERAPGA
ncbi:MAG: hypothetical protein M0014_14540 [Actinomycetota bacterium]|nr:hypothetical protein [Actinomycetota bacterium]